MQLEDLAQRPFDRLGKPGVEFQLFLTGRQPTLHPEEHRHCLNNAGASQFLVDVFKYFEKNMFKNIALSEMVGLMFTRATNTNSGKIGQRKDKVVASDGNERRVS